MYNSYNIHICVSHTRYMNIRTCVAQYTYECSYSSVNVYDSLLIAQDNEEHRGCHEEADAKESGECVQ